MGTPNVTIDPVTRIEGHLRVECEVTNGTITDAWVSCSLFRGMELVMKGRAPSDAFYVAQRICGVCPISHGHASTMSAESALGITIPNGARIVRNIIEAAQYLHSHILWFYTLAALDYIDPGKALQANIANTYALAEQVGTTTSDFKAVQDKLKGLVAGGALAISNVVPGAPASSLTLEVANLDAALASVRAANLPLAIDVMEFPPCRMFAIKDPDGNQIGLHQRKATA